DDLLDVSRVTRGLVTLNQEAVDINRVLDDAVEQIRPMVEGRKHALTVMPAMAPAMVLGDRKRLVQSLANLLNNAAKYTPDGGHITAQVQVDDEHVTIAITDNGIGMTADLVRHA